MSHVGIVSPSPCFGERKGIIHWCGQKGHWVPMFLGRPSTPRSPSHLNLESPSELTFPDLTWVEEKATAPLPDSRGPSHPEGVVQAQLSPNPSRKTEPLTSTLIPWPCPLGIHQGPDNSQNALRDGGKLKVPQPSSHPNPDFAPSDLRGPCGQTRSPYIYAPPPKKSSLSCAYPLRGLSLVSKMDPSLPSTSINAGEDLERQLVWSDFVDFFHLPLLSLGRSRAPSPGKACTSGGEEFPPPCLSYEE